MGGRRPASWPRDWSSDVCSSDLSKGKEVADAIGGQFYEADVTDFTGIEQVLNDAVAALGGLRIVVTTAGGGIGQRTIKKDGPHDLESFRNSLDLNVTGTFNVNRLAAWHMTTNTP